MNILLLGAGGREHALAWKMKKSNHAVNLLIAPGNAGTSTCGTNIPLSLSDFDAISKCCKDHAIELVVIGPEEPLVKGIVDELKSFSPELMIIGPSKEAARLEGSKAYAKSFMNRHKIPTADYKEFTEENFETGVDYIRKHRLPIVMKADGLAAGKGVIICQNYVEAFAEFELMIQRSKFGEAGKRVVIEEFLDGIELSVFVLTDGRNYVLLPEAKDYKRIGEGDKGLNTGGMGAISPVPFADNIFMKKVIERIIVPTIKGLEEDKLEYKGFIFFGLIKVGDEPMLIEYNCRMGDPETEVVMPRIKNDLVDLFIKTANGDLADVMIEKDNRFASTIVAVSEGYPNRYQTGFEIRGLIKSEEDAIVFHSGTVSKNGKTLTNGGRVLCATALGSRLEDALERSKELVELVSYEGKYFRRDIGYEFLKNDY